MKPTGSESQGGQKSIHRTRTDPLTAILLGLALLLTAAIAALCVDLWPQPGNGNPVLPALAAQEPAGLATTSPGVSTPASSPLPISTPPPAAVRIRIPAIGVDRSIIELPLTYDSRSRAWKQDFAQLFRRGKKDLVGHYNGSASPGQPGNTILVGHNYGYGVKGVFQRLGRLKAGQHVEIVNARGQIFTYRVAEVVRIPWTRKTQQELLEHQAYLSVEGDERLTLVTCGGSQWEPFPERVYVVAEPAP